MLGATQASALSTILAEFWPTFLIELAVIVFVARVSRRDARLGPLGRRLLGGRLHTAGLWCVPFYVWAWQANRFFAETYSGPDCLACTGLGYQRSVVTIFVSLFYLLLLRTIGTMITNDAPATLGMTGYSRTAVTAGILSVFLNVAFYLAITREFPGPGLLPLLLQ